MKFWDSSAIVPLLVAEAQTPWATALYRADPVQIVWWATEVECVSAIARLERSGILRASALTDATARLRELKSNWQEVQALDVVRESALRLLRVHELRAADALQLAAAIIASQHRPPSLAFISLDARLTAAAAREGFVGSDSPVPE